MEFNDQLLLNWPFAFFAEEIPRLKIRGISVRSKEKK